MKMKAICDTLATFRRPGSEEDQVLPILTGLGPELEPTIAILISRNDAYNVTYLRKQSQISIYLH